jgi:hypothetical protein
MELMIQHINRSLNGLFSQNSRKLLLIIAAGSFLFTAPRVQANDAQEAACDSRSDIKKAHPIQIGMMESDATPGKVYHLYGLLDDQSDLIGLAVQRTDDPSGTRYSICQIEKGEATFKDEGSGKVFAYLQGNGLDTRHGGELKLGFLYNGIRNTYRSIPLRAQQTRGNWELYSDQRKDKQGTWQTVNHFFLAKRTMMGKTIGINHVEVSYRNLRRVELRD